VTFSGVRVQAPDLMQGCVMPSYTSQ